MGKKIGVAITRRVADGAKAAAARYHVWDNEVLGFGLRVEPGGTKTYVVKYRAGDGGRRAEQKLVTLGRHGALAPEQARKLAKQVLANVIIGTDPASELKERRRRMTVADLIDLYEAEGCFIQRGKRQGEPMKERTKAYTIARLRHHVVPLLGRRVAAEINAGDVERFVRDVEAGKTARTEKIGPRRVINVRGGEGAARKVARDLSAVFSFAGRREIVTRNPCETAAIRKTDNHRERFLTIAEVKRLGLAFRDLEADGTNTKALNIMRLWALTGCRRDEIASLKWSEIDLAHGCLRLDDSKTGKSIRPLGLAAIMILKSVVPEGESKFVFPADRGDGHFQGYKSPWKRAIAKAKLDGVSPHTLRHTIGSTAISSGEAMAFAGAILGHANARSTAIYAHVQHEPARQVADRVSEKIAKALGGIETDDQPLPNTETDEELLVELGKRLETDGPEAEQLRRLLKAVVDRLQQHRLPRLRAAG
jgi:integrase